MKPMAVFLIVASALKLVSAQDFLNYPRVDFFKADPYQSNEYDNVYVWDINKYKKTAVDKVEATVFLTERLCNELASRGKPVSAKVVLYLFDSKYDPNGPNAAEADLITSVNYKKLASSKVSFGVRLKPEYREMSAESIYESNRSFEFVATAVQLPSRGSKIIGHIGDIVVTFADGSTWTASGALIGEQQ